jgi:glycerate 2-kinase
MGLSSPALRSMISRSHGARRDALLAASDALAASDPALMVRRAIRLAGSTLEAGGARYRLAGYRRVVVIGGGKASALMAGEVERELGAHLDGGIIIVPEFQTGLPHLRRLKYAKSTHPLPTRKGRAAVKKMLEEVRAVGKHDLVICLISGGGSAMMPMPLEGVSVEDLRETTNLMLRSGVEIREMNCVRKHLSQIGGGRLAELVNGADVLSLLVSDIVGDDPGSVASGPTVPDSTTFSMAEDVLRRHGIWAKAPSSVRTAILAGVAGRIEETPKPGSRVFDRVNNLLVGSNRLACAAAKGRLESLGYTVPDIIQSVTGEAREFGRKLANLARNKAKGRPWAAVAGGETTVTVKGAGRGGRNEEVALSAAIAIDGLPDVTVLSLGTDGMDGTSDAAGAIADSTSAIRARRAGLDPQKSLEENDSHTFFKMLGDLVVTGPTGTNVNDVMLVLGGRPRVPSRSP